MKNKLFFFLIALLSVFYMACDKAEQVPAYIYIKPFTVQTDYTKEGANTSKITEAWVFAGDDLLGAYTLPAEVPILSAGDTKITIYAGVRDNGDNSTPSEYFHYQPVVVQKILTPTKTDTITPVAIYDKTLKFRWLDDFEGVNNILSNNIDNDDTLNLQITSLDVKYGKQCALFEVDKKHPVMSVTSKAPFDNLPQKNRIYVEMDYKGDVPIIVELYGVKNTGREYIDAASFRDKNEWNKAYVNFSKSINTSYSSYDFVFTAILPLDDKGNFTKDKGEVRLDNIKLIHP